MAYFNPRKKPASIEVGGVSDQRNRKPKFGHFYSASHFILVIVLVFSLHGLANTVAAQVAEIPVMTIMPGDEFDPGAELTFTSAATFENTLGVHVQVRCTRKIFAIPQDGFPEFYLYGTPMGKGEAILVNPGDKIKDDDVGAFTLNWTYTDTDDNVIQQPIERYVMTVEVEWRTYAMAMPGPWHSGQAKQKLTIRKE